MSDGPHRTLQMRRPWKKLTECADRAAYSDSDVVQLLLPALSADWNAEVRASTLSSVIEALERSKGPALFEDQCVRDLEAVRVGVKSPLEALLVEAALDAAHEGRCGQDAVLFTVEVALEERALRGARQVEEHWLRNAPDRRARHMRERLETAISQASIGELAKSICGVGPRPAMHVRKRDGLEDGVPM